MKQLRYFFLMVMTCTFTYMQAQNKIPAQTQRYIPIAIDLGLPSGTLWADRNMRENEASTNFGQFYSWGSVVADDEALAYEEHNQRSMTSWRGYKHGSGAKALTKYCTDSAYGKKDDKTQLDPEDDAAAVYAKTHQVAIWDAQWHIPTEKEFAELIEKCKWTWKNNGYEVTGPNGKSIFLPAAGMSGHNLPYIGQYWTSTLCADFPCYAYAVIFGDDFITWNNSSRCSGCSIRPVKKK